MNVEERLTSHLQRLAVDIGPRPSGSQGNHAAAAYVQDVFWAAGLQVEEQRYACPAWQHQETCLELAGERLEAAANAFSPSCDVSAATAAIGTVAELETAELRGRIGVLYGDLTRSPLAAKAWPYKSEQDKRAVELLEEKEPAALLTVQTKAGSLERLIEDSELAIPSATVPAGVGLALLRQSAPTVHLRIKSRRASGHSCNVVARKAGARQARIVMCAHYDTKVDTPGASDNAGGVSVLLALAQLLSQSEHALGLEWVAFSGEESLPLGDDEYVRRCSDSFGQIVVAINLDGVGRYLGANNYTVMASSESFKAHVSELSQRYPGVVWVDPWPESNHSAFANRGVPSMALSSSSGGSVAHLRSDTVEQVSPAKLREALSLVADIVGSLQDKQPGWTRQDKNDGYIQ